MNSSSKDIDCPVCVESKLTGDSQSGWQCCGVCGSLFLLPEPDALANSAFAVTTAGAELSHLSGSDHPLAIAQQAGLGPGSSILDLRCGEGRRLRALLGHSFKLFGVEANAAQFRLAQHSIGREAFLYASSDEMVPHSFDLILMDGVLDHAFDPAEVFYRLFALGAIVPDTKIAITVSCAPATGALSKAKDEPLTSLRSRYTLDGLQRLLKRLQFSIDQIELHDGGEVDTPFITAIASQSAFADFMQERYVPGTWSKIAEYEHMPRYQLALALCHGKHVLDFGCGTGYGSALLSDVAASVTGVDIDRLANQWARNTHRSDNLKFDLRDDFAEGLAGGTFDVITCFEMIEHVAEPEQIRAIKSFARLLKPEGVLLISTPNPEVTAQYGVNPYHLREMTRSQFSDLLNTHFAVTEITDQTVLSSVAITQSGAKHWSSMTPMFLESEMTALPLAFIGRCSQVSLAELGNTVIFDRGSDVIHAYLQSARQQNELKFKNYQLSELSAGLFAQRDAAEVALADTQAALTQSQRQAEQLQHSMRAVQARSNALAEALGAFHASRTFQFKKAIRERQAVRAMRLAVGFFIPQPLAALLRGQTTRVASGASSIPGREAVSDGQSAPPEARRPVSSVVAASPQAYRVKTPAPVTSNRPRVLHAIANFMIGGSSRLVVDLIEHLGGSYEQKVLAGYIPEPPAYLNLSIVEIRDDNSPVAVRRLIDEFQPDIVHVHYWGDTDEQWYRQVFEVASAAACVVVQNINTPVQPFPARFAQNVFVSEYVQRDFGNHNPGRVIYPGSDFSLFANPAFGDQAEDCVAMVYRLEPDKLNQAAIEPFIKIVQQRPATKALIVGGGSLLETFKRRCAEEGVASSFEFTGYVPYTALPELYRRMSLFIAPVWQESFGQVTPFAMNMGIPVIGYAVGAIDEIIQDETLVAAPGDAQALADIAIAVLDDRPRRSLIGRRNHARAEQLFEVHAMVDAYRTLYAQVLKMKPA